MGVGWKVTSVLPPASGVFAATGMFENAVCPSGAVTDEREVALNARLVPHRREAAAVGGLELGDQHPLLLAAYVGIIDREHARRPTG